MGDEKRNLMVNFLPKNMQTSEFESMFSLYGPIEKAHIVRAKNNESKGYGFVVFENEDDAASAVTGLNGHQVADKKLRVAYAANGANSSDRPNKIQSSANDINVYIASIPKAWSERELKAQFENYGAIKHVKVLKDRNGTSRGAGFVRYESSKEAAAAILDMDGCVPDGGTLPLIVKIADANKKSTSSGPTIPSHVPGLVLNRPSTPPITDPYPHASHVTPDNRYNPYAKPTTSTVPGSLPPYNHPGAYPPIAPGYNMSHGAAPPTASANPVPPHYPTAGYQPANVPGYNSAAPHPSAPPPQPKPTPSVVDPSKQTYCIYIGNLPETSCKCCLLYQLFGPFGGIANVKPMANVNPDAGNDHWFGFVNMKHYGDAYAAIQALNQSTLNGRTLKVDFKTEKKK